MMPVDQEANYSSDAYNPFYPSLDHILPRSLGGTHDSSNLRTAHLHCNSMRGADTSDLLWA
jgi:5-methylcytosine-specific restriction endonuclease McrA